LGPPFYFANDGGRCCPEADRILVIDKQLPVLALQEFLSQDCIQGQQALPNMSSFAVTVLWKLAGGQIQGQ